MSMSVRDEKISSEKVDLSIRVMTTSDQRICDSLITSIYWNIFITSTVSLSNWWKDIRWNSWSQSESRDYSVWRSSDSSITLIYWKSLNSSSLLDIKSYICLREKLRAQKNDQNAFSSINQSQSSNDCDRTFILTIHSTSTWHKLSQEKKRVVQYNHTLSSHRTHLSFITYFLAQWMTIIEQENTALCTLQSWASRVQRKRLSSSN